MKVLVVDDSKAMRTIVIRHLRQAGFDGHTYVEAQNGVEAMSVVKSGPPDMILSDWNMPEMTGIELLDNLNKEGIKIKFGFVTSESTPEMRDKASASGALFLIGKPFTVESFKQTLQPYLG